VPGLLFLDEPDVAVTDGVAVVLEVERAGVFAIAEWCGGGGVGEFDVVVDDGAVVFDGGAGVGGFFCRRRRRWRR